jgi:hypothetical protein
MASIVSSIVISKFLHCTILENFNLKWTRIQRGVDLGCCWMLFFLLRRVCWPALEECYVACLSQEPLFIHVSGASWKLSSSEGCGGLLSDL